MNYLFTLRYPLLLALLAVFLAPSYGSGQAAGVATPIALQDFSVGGFWRDQYRRVTVHWLPHCVRQMEKGGRGQELLNLINAGKALAGQEHGDYTGLPWSDAYVYNTVEAICLALSVDASGDAEWSAAQRQLRETVDKWVPIIVAAQRDGGYIHSYHTVNGRPHYTRIGDHEFYVMGYFIEMAVAHHRLTGGADSRLYDAALRLADHLEQTFGPAPKRTWKNGHAGLEYALCRLARRVDAVEGEGAGERYYRLAKHFLDHQHEIGPNPYNQSHRPAVAMQDATGHAVRATYFYTAMADMALRGHEDYLAASDRLWESAIQRKHYITGGVGASHNGEAFAADYDLRNDGYCESCASCGLGFWADRMHRLHGRAHYHDVFERLIYNNVLGALELSGRNFFYQNPLSADNQRYPWHVCPCCVGNIPRTLLMLKDVAYSTDASRGTLYVNHYLQSEATLADLAGGDFRIEQTTRYPWDGGVTLRLGPARPAELTIKLRIPDRTESDLYTTQPDLDGRFQLRVNGEAVSAELQDGYVAIQREWEEGDTIELTLPMDLQRVRCDPRVEANRGRVAVTRGPIVYNFENADHQADVRGLVLKPDTPLEAEWAPDMLGGVMAVRGLASVGDSAEVAPLLGVPNYARLNRGGYTQVWMLERAQKAETAE